MSDGLIHGLITEEALDLMRERIGYPNPTLRGGLLSHRPWVSELTDDAIYHYAMGVGDNNPLFWDPAYAAASRWGTSVGPPGIEMAMGWRRNSVMDPVRAKVTSKALRGVHLFYSGSEHFYWRPVATAPSSTRPSGSTRSNPKLVNMAARV
jgi:acyl dehydratase